VKRTDGTSSFSRGLADFPELLTISDTFSGLAADHNGIAVLTVTTSTAVPGDLNDDGSVNAADLSILLGTWGACGSPCTAHLDGDGAVGASDLAALLGAWS